MTISSNVPRITFTCNGVTTDFPYPYPVFSIDDLVVKETVIATSVEEGQVTPTDWAIVEVPDADGSYPNGVTIRAITAPPATVTWTVINDPLLTQPVNLTDNGPLPVDTQVERPLDRLTLIVQRIRDVANRAIRQPEGESANIGLLPSLVQRASTYLGFNASGDPVALAAPTDTSITTAFSRTLLDDANAAAARGTLGFPSLGVDGKALEVTAGGMSWVQQYPRSLAPNPFFHVTQLTDGVLTAADDTYRHDHWYALTQTGTINVSTQLWQENGLPTSARLHQTQAAAQRMGYACILEAKEAQKLRGLDLTLYLRVRPSTTQLLNMAILEWTGTADAVTSDIVNDWTSTDFTDGAAKFFVDANFNVLGVSSQNKSGGVFSSMLSLIAAVGSSCNNLVIFIWTNDPAAQDVTLDMGKVALLPSFHLGEIYQPTFEETLRYGQRFFMKSFRYGTAPAENIGLNTGELVWTATLAGAVANVSPTFNFPVPMRIPPALTLLNPGAAGAQVRNTTDSTDHTSSGGGNITEDRFFITSTGAAGTAVGEVLRVHVTANARL